MIPLLLLSLTPGLVILLFAGCPTLLLYWQRVHIASSLSLAKPALRVWPAAAILGLATWPWIFKLLNALRSFAIVRIDPQTFASL